MLVGKTVPRDKSVYLGKADLKTAFLEVHKKLSLTNGRMTTIESKDKEIAELQTELNQQRLLVKAMAEMFGTEILEKAKKSMIGKLRLESAESLTPMQILELYASGLEEQEKREYRKRLENNNGNGGS